MSHQNYPVLIQVKTLEIQHETDSAKKQLLYRQLRVLEYHKEIEDIREKIEKLNNLNKIDKEKS